MPSLHLRDLSYAHSAATPVLDRVTLDLATSPNGPTWVGIVGANGSGKTTLLRLIVGALTPTGGRLDVQAAVAPVLVPQEVGELDDAVRAFAWAWNGHAQRLRSRLDLDPDDLDPDLGRGWSGLSPGQRKRWQIAAALAADPDVLLLDEPTNHLDGDARDVLAATLRAHRGLGLVVSHDRRFLDDLTEQTVRLVGGDAEVHAGRYSEARDRWRQQERTRRQAHDRARRRLRRERRILSELRRDRHSAEAAPRRERRLAGASQPDAREAGRKLAQQKAESALAARVRQMNARAARAEQALEHIEVTRDHRGSVGFDHIATGRPILAAVAGDVPHAGGAVLLRDVDVALERGEKVHVRGANGAGKTTLLRAVLDAFDRTGETAAALPQELSTPVAEIEKVRALDPATRGRVLGVVARLGVDPERVLVTDRPSPGEARKLAIAGLLVRTASVVVLDEPTNHLDLPSIEALQEALVGYPGALLLVTHDDALAAATTTTTWRVADGRVTVTSGSP